MKKLLLLFILFLASCATSYYRRGDLIYVTEDKQGVITKINPLKQLVYVDTTYYYMKNDGTWVIPLQIWYVDSLNYY